jgi:hypothetical protein
MMQRSPAALLMASVTLLVGCAYTMNGSDIPLIETQSPLEQISPRSFAFQPFIDARGTTSLEIKSIGVHKLTLVEPPAEMVANALKRELLKAGHAAVDATNSTNDFLIEGTLRVFGLIVGSDGFAAVVSGHAVLDLAIRRNTSGKDVFTKAYQGEHQMRSNLAIPSSAWKTIMGQAVANMIKNISMDEKLVGFVSKKVG